MTNPNNFAVTVSVIMPSYNTQQFIGESVKSVLAQTMADLELIVIDDCSSDDSVSVARNAAADDPRVRIISLEQNSGVASARNAGIDQARGRYIAFLDSDDLWFPSKLERQIAFMEKHQLPFSYTRYDVIDEAGTWLTSIPAPEKIEYADLLRCCPIGCLTVVYDREKVGTVHMPLLRKRQDWATWLRILSSGGSARGILETQGAYRLREGSLSRKKSSLLSPIWAVYRQDQGFGRMRAAFYITLYAANGILRKYVPGFSERFGFI